MESLLENKVKSQPQMAPRPNCYMLVEAAAEARTQLNAFDKALLKAGVGDTNLMRVSSILPPNAQHMKTLRLPAGGLIPIAYASITSNQPGQKIASAVAVGIPEDPNEAGVIMEWEDTCGLTEVKKVVRQMVEDAFAYRNRALNRIEVAGAEHTVERCGAAFAGVVLWYESHKDEE